MIAPDRIAIVAITKHGSEIAERLHAGLPGAALFISSKFRREIPGRVTWHERPIRDLTGELWGAFDALVYLVSLGAVVRTIAAFLKDKHTDPAVVVVDDRARFAISVLSGHVGGANDVAEGVARILGALPVVTTASDVGKTIPVDILGREFGWRTEQDGNITRVSAAVVNEEPVAIFQDAGERDWWLRETPLPKNLVRVASLDEAKDARYPAALLITDRAVRDPTLLAKAVVYRPRTIVLGIGCDRGVSVDEVERFVRLTLEEAGLAFASVRNLATVDLKRLEPGLVAFAHAHDLSVDTFTRDELNGIEIPHPSEAAMKFLRVQGVAEPSALLSAKAKRLVVEKVKTAKITLAVARAEPGGGGPAAPSPGPAAREGAGR